MKCPECFAEVEETSGSGSEAYKCTGCGEEYTGLACDYLLVEDEDTEELSPRYSDEDEDDTEELNSEPEFMDATEYREAHPDGIVRA